MLEDGFTASLMRFEDWMLIQNFTKETIKSKLQHLNCFFDWAEERGFEKPQEITKNVLDGYQRYLCSYRQEKGHI